jgi:hypothetical protein
MITEKEFAEVLKIEELGFKYCEDYQYYGTVYKKKTNDGIVHLNVELLNNSFKRLGCFIEFPVVENLSEFLIRKFNISLNRGVYRPITLSSSNIINPSENILSNYKKVKDDKIHLKAKNVQEVADMVYEYLTQVYQPFWEKYSSLQVVNDEIIEKVEQMKLSDYIPFETPWKKMVIMKICDNPNYDNYINWLEEIWAKKTLSEDLSLNNNYLMYQELKDILENGKLEDYA